MASEQGKLCSHIIREHFGEVVEKVSNALHWGPQTLGLIVSSSQLPASKVKEALTVLIKHGFVTFERGKVPTVAEYKFIPTKVSLLLRYPRYILQIKTRLDVESSLLLEELLKCGNDTATNTMLRVYTRINEGNLELDRDLSNLRDKFHMLIQMQYLMRCPHPTDPEATTIEVPELGVTEAELFLPPNINIKNLSLLSQGMAAEHPGDNGIYWRINFDRFHQDTRPSDEGLERKNPQVPVSDDGLQSLKSSSHILPTSHYMKPNNPLGKRNLFERNRRAYLRDCFRLLGKQLPPSSDRERLSDIRILAISLRYIAVLKLKEEEFENEIERLTHQKNYNQHKLALLKSEETPQGELIIERAAELCDKGKNYDIHVDSLRNTLPNTPVEIQKCNLNTLNSGNLHVADKDQSPFVCKEFIGLHEQKINIPTKVIPDSERTNHEFKESNIQENKTNMEKHQQAHSNQCFIPIKELLSCSSGEKRIATPSILCDTTNYDSVSDQKNKEFGYKGNNKFFVSGTILLQKESYDLIKHYKLPEPQKMIMNQEKNVLIPTTTKTTLKKPFSNSAKETNFSNLKVLCEAVTKVGYCTDFKEEFDHGRKKHSFNMTDLDQDEFQSRKKGRKLSHSQLRVYKEKVVINKGSNNLENYQKSHMNYCSKSPVKQIPHSPRKKRMSKFHILCDAANYIKQRKRKCENYSKKLVNSKRHCPQEPNSPNVCINLHQIKDPKCHKADSLMKDQNNVEDHQQVYLQTHLESDKTCVTDKQMSFGFNILLQAALQIEEST